MEDRRRDFRYPVSIQLNISDLFTGESDGIHGLASPVEVADISRGGLCFISECILPVGYYLNASIRLCPGSTPPAFSGIRILRAEVIDRTHYRYGCPFTTILEDPGEIITSCSLSENVLSDYFPPSGDVWS